MSRKKQVYEKITALYCRISLDDGGDNESMSISNQKIMLRDFAEKHGMFQYEYYVDDGYTGRNFNRPAFQRMIADIEAGKIGCVITKDLSRLGRNYIEAGSYIEIFFPKHNVRYIAVTDGVDSLTRRGTVCQEVFARLSKLNFWAVEVPPKTSRLQMSKSAFSSGFFAFSACFTQTI